MFKVAIANMFLDEFKIEDLAKRLLVEELLSKKFLLDKAVHFQKI